MAEETILTDDFIRQLIGVGEVDILIGVPTHNNAKTVGAVIQAIRAGILKSFPRERAVIVNTDASSNDGTPEIILGAAISDARRSFDGYALRTLHSISTQYGRTPSAELSFHTILAAAELLRARACAVISPEATTMEPAWIEYLVQPVYRDNFDLVTPVYRRHKFEGVLLTNLVYPMTRALYGERLREPYSSEMAFSSRLGSQFLAQHAWTYDANDPRMEFAIAALAYGFRAHQTFLGDRETPRSQSTDLLAAIRHTIGILFSSLEPTFPVWSSKTGSEAVPTRGPEFTMNEDGLRVNRKRLKQMFSEGVKELSSVLEELLTPAPFGALQQIAGTDELNFRFSCELWVRTVYEFAASYHRSVINRDHILQALVPLYRGRMFSYLSETRNASVNEVAKNIEHLCLEFEQGKPYLLQLWNGGK